MNILFYHPANYLEIGIPQGIAILSAVLKEQGHRVDLFDTAFTKPKGYKAKQNAMMAGPTIYKRTEYTIEDLVSCDPEADREAGFQKKIDECRPDLVAVSTMTTNYESAIETLKKVNTRCPIIMGGVHPTISPDEVIAEEKIDMLCIGEGEDALSELCRAIEGGKDYTTIKNL